MSTVECASFPKIAQLRVNSLPLVDLLDKDTDLSLSIPEISVLTHLDMILF